MILGTATWAEGPGERRALVARLESGRAADLNRIEAVRLRKLGEGDPDRLAEALVPPSLRRALEGGPRALARLRQTLAYAEKWDRRGTLPETLAPRLEAIELLPCLPRPAALRRAEGGCLDRLRVTGPGGLLRDRRPVPPWPPWGSWAARPRGFCLALGDGEGAVLGGWMVTDWPEGHLDLRAGTHRRRIPFGAWEGLELPLLRPGEALLLPPPRLKPLPDLEPGPPSPCWPPSKRWTLRLGLEALHPTVQ